MEKKKLNRLESLDVLRGFDLFCLVVLEMVLHPLAHAIDMPWFNSFMWGFSHVEWEGFSTWDLVMPLFLFMAGVSMPFSLSRYKDMPDKMARRQSAGPQPARPHGGRGLRPLCENAGAGHRPGDVHKAIELLCKHGVPARKLFFYVLIRDDTEDALGRIRELKALGCQPFAQPYRDFEHEGKPSREQWRLAYWCNRKPLFYSVDYEEYRKKRT